MGSKYIAYFAKYPYPGYYASEIQSNFLIPFLLKILIQVAKYQYDIVDVQYRK